MNVLVKTFGLDRTLEIIKEEYDAEKISEVIVDFNMLQLSDSQILMAGLRAIGICISEQNLQWPRDLVIFSDKVLHHPSNNKDTVRVIFHSLSMKDDFVAKLIPKIDFVFSHELSDEEWTLINDSPYPELKTIFQWEKKDYELYKRTESYLNSNGTKAFYSHLLKALDNRCFIIFNKKKIEYMLADLTLLEKLQYYTDNEHRSIAKKQYALTDITPAAINMILSTDCSVYEVLRNHIHPDEIIEASHKFIPKMVTTDNQQYVMTTVSDNMFPMIIPHLSVPLRLSCLENDSWNDHYYCDIIRQRCIKHKITIAHWDCKRYPLPQEVIMEEAEGNCNICYMECDKKVSCGHHFHHECLTYWILTSNQTNCSLCFQQLNTKVSINGVLPADPDWSDDE